jgi:hypothetical protein
MERFGFGETALIVITLLILGWLGLIIYCISDILKGRFKFSPIRILFLLLVLFFPFLGVHYLSDYTKSI